MTLRIGKQHELPKRPGDYRTAKGDMNRIPDSANKEAEEIRRRTEKKGPPAQDDAKAKDEK